MRIAVVGATGAGKSTFSAELARRTGAPHVELDGLHWDDDWTERADDDFRTRLEPVLARDAWVIDGNYGRAGVRERIFAEADAIAWLDLPRRTILRRILARSIRRAWTKQPLWGTNNRESFRLSFLSKDSVILWSMRSFADRRRTYEALIAQDDAVARKFRRIRSPREAARVLDELAGPRIS